MIHGILLVLRIHLNSSHPITIMFFVDLSSPGHYTNCYSKRTQ